MPSPFPPLANIYTRAAYARRIDYSRPAPSPKLRPSMQVWLEEIKIDD